MVIIVQPQVILIETEVVAEVAETTLGQQVQQYQLIYLLGFMEIQVVLVQRVRQKLLGVVVVEEGH